jgi:ribA/ribD-fused uncharacterized protein
MNYTKYTFFYSRHPFSNWHPSKFVDQDGIEYNCSEQWMMSEKARFFGDDIIREMILVSKDPSEQKDLGRRVKNFNSSSWELVAKDLVYKGLFYKFTQNDSMLKKLLETKGTLIVEASPYDKIWGIGLAENDKRIHDPKNWLGKNWLGEVLTKLRDDLITTSQSR